MKLIWNIVGAAVLLLLPRAAATTFYVNVSNTTPAVPYDTWPHASTNFQKAIDYANFVNEFQPNAGSIFLVSNGIYRTGSDSLNGYSRVAATNAYLLKSVNGPAVTVIEGHRATNNNDTPIRCVYLSGGAILSGFTLTNGGDGSQMAGGVGCVTTNEVVTNCIIIGNQGYYGGGVYQGFVKNCVIVNNTNSFFTGAAWKSVLNHCVITNNPSGYSYGSIYSCKAYNCLLMWPSESLLINCTIVSPTNYSGVNNCLSINCILPYLTITSPGLFTNCCLNPLPAYGSPGANTFTNAPLFVNVNDVDWPVNGGPNNIRYSPTPV